MNKKLKEAKWDKQHTKAAQNNWAKRLEQETGTTTQETIFEGFTYEKMWEVCGESWTDVIKFGEENDVEVKNIVAIMGKDTRKTTVFVIFMWFVMTYYDKMNGFLLRDTIDKATTQMRMQLRKAAALITNEYGIDGFVENTKESSDGFYLVRDAKRKDNQKIELLSFDSIVEMGGFTTSNGFPAIFVYDELQNPNSAKKAIQAPETFLANYKFIDSKNEAIELSTDYAMPKWIPRHYFLSNRYIGDHPLNLFAEAHFPFYDQIEDDGTLTQGAKSWMLEDPLNNNFIAHYVGEDNVKEEWEDFAKTLIIYGSKLSNYLLRKSKEWEDKQIKLIERGKEEDLAVIVGDLYEGYEESEKAYHYTRKDKITREVFETNYAPYATAAYISVDLDFTRQIRFRPKYALTKDKGFGLKIHRFIREKAYKIDCKGLSNDGRLTWEYQKRANKIIEEITEYINKTMPQIRKVQILFDDNSANWPKDFNYGEFKSNKWSAAKMHFKNKWPIPKRPSDMDQAQDSGFMIDIEEHTNTFLHQGLKNVIIKEGSKPSIRVEKTRDAFVDDMNSDEYPLYLQLPRMAANNRTTRLLGGKNEWD